MIDWATAVPAWSGAVAALVAAVASVAVWRQKEVAVGWKVELADRGRSSVVNTGNRTARHVHVRVGSVSTPSAQDGHADAERLGPNEAIPIVVAPSYASPEDFSVIVTWRSRFGRSHVWTRVVV